MASSGVSPWATHPENSGDIAKYTTSPDSHISCHKKCE
jgi:hypothetical protein